MAITIVDGKKSLGSLGTQHYTAGTREAEIAEAMAMTIQAGNYKELQNMNDVSTLLSSLEKEVPRIDGQIIPVEIHNVFFSQGGLQSEAVGFDTYYKNFTLRKGMPLQVKVYSHTGQEILDARNAGIDLLEKDAEDLRRASQAYVNRYLQAVKLLPLITGSSLTTKIPTTATVGTDDDYTRAFGWVRGEDVSDFIPATQGITHANHYRALKGANISESDITDVVDLLESYDNYSGSGIVAIAHPRTIQQLGVLYSYSANTDKMLIDNIRAKSFLGIEWVESTHMSKDFIVFVDSGNTELIIKCVNKDEAQRGFKLVQENKIEPFKLTDGVDGAKAVIFEEEYHIASRYSGAILDISTQGNADGSMTEASVTKLENFAKTLEALYKR